MDTERAESRSPDLIRALTETVVALCGIDLSTLPPDAALKIEATLRAATWSLRQEMTPHTLVVEKDSSGGADNA